MKKLTFWSFMMLIAMALPMLTACGNSQKQAPSTEQTVEEAIVDTPDTTSVNDNKNYVGRWKLDSPMAPDLNSTIEIYEEEGEYYYKETYDKGSVKTVKVRKDGNKYYDIESTFGEYFLVENGEMHIFDNEGEYGGGKGYTIKPIN